LSCSISAGGVLTSMAGTEFYMAPEVLAGQYDHMCDMWSVGVIMYIMLCGSPPFFGETSRAIFGDVRQGNFSFQDPVWEPVSQDAKDLINNLLTTNPRNRYSAEKALNHTWIKQKAPRANQVTLSLKNFVNKLRGFRSHNKLKKAALSIIARQVNEEQIAQWRETFISLDDNGDGLLTGPELKQGLAKAGLKDIASDLQQILEDVDLAGNGVINYTEFLAATLDERAYFQEDVCWAAFRLLDKNGDNKISKEELQEVVQNGDADDAAARSMAYLMAEVDQNNDGEIDFDEFMHMMKASTK